MGKTNGNDTKTDGVDMTPYPLLGSISNPEDIRSFDIEQLEALSAEIRAFLINSLATNPGHFASSMGAVELTVALHYVFNTPYDRIVWDVGHQAYGHKLLTGRAKKFDTNRKLGGISGFPNPDESEYDTFTAGHASNSISAALGMSVASSLKKESPRRNVIAVIGDASISGGLAFEGINNAANSRNNLLIILNDNDMSIDRNVGSLNSYLAHLTTSKSYNAFRYKLYKLMKKMHLVSERRRGSILRFNNSLKSFLTHEQNIFEGLNVRYFGPFDGHDIHRIVRVLNDIKDMEGPRILHLRTVKGKGFEEAEKNPAVWHAPGKFNPETGEIVKSSDNPLPPKYQDVFAQTLIDIARHDDRVVGITAAMPSGTSMKKFQDAYPDRTFDVGISEGHAVTFAGGLAKDGMRPYIAIYSSFLQRGFDHVIHDVAIQKLPVVFCIDRAGLVGEDGVTHHGTFDICYLRSIPGMNLASPRNEEYLSRLMYTAQANPQLGPFAIRYPRGRGEFPVQKDHSYSTDLLTVGRGEKLVDGDDVVILAIGPIVSEALKAAEMARKEGINAAVYDMIFVKPIDMDIIKQVGLSGKPVITIEDGTVVGGFGTAVMEALSDLGFNNSVHRIGVPDSFVGHGTVGQLRALCDMDANAIYNRIKDLKTQ